MAENLAPLQIELREAMAGQGCPLCHIAMRTERTYLDSLNYERVLDLNTRDALKASRGLCERHSRGWQHLQGSALGIAIVYRISVLDLLRATEAEPKKASFLRRAGGGPGAVADVLEPSEPCVACSLVEETVARFADLLLKDMRDPEVQSSLEACGGLCLPHLRTTLRRPRAGRAYETLIAVQRRAWSNLMAELDEFIRKNDYRFRHEPMGTERDAWLRALDTIVGLDAAPPED